MTEDGPPHAQVIQPIIQRLNTVINLINDYPIPEIVRYNTLFPIGITENISYSNPNSFQLFGENFLDLEYDEKLFEIFRIPLLPIINEDKIIFDGEKLQIQNEGLGALPPFSISIVVSEAEFEIIEYSGTVEAENTKNLYIDDQVDLTQFLKQQNPNTDIKIKLIFKKFGKSYEYNILTDSVGDWLQRVPSSSIEVALPFEAPLERLSPKEFERLCYWIVEEYKTDEGSKRFDNVVWLGEDGGGEQGRDVIAREKATGKDFVFQCKRVEKFRPNDIRKELQTFQGYISDEPEIKPHVYILFLSSAITSETIKIGDKLAREMEIEIDYWAKSKIDRLVRTNETVRERFWKKIQEN